MATDNSPGAAGDSAAAHRAETEKLIAQARGITPTSELRTLTFELANALEAAEAEKASAVSMMEAYRTEAHEQTSEVERLTEAAKKVTDAYTAESEDHNDGEFALWDKADLINAIVALRAALAAGGREEVK